MRYSGRSVLFLYCSDYHELPWFFCCFFIRIVSWEDQFFGKPCYFFQKKIVEYLCRLWNLLPHTLYHARPDHQNSSRSRRILGKPGLRIRYGVASRCFGRTRGGRRKSSRGTDRWTSMPVLAGISLLHGENSICFIIRFRQNIRENGTTWTINRWAWIGYKSQKGDRMCAICMNTALSG